MWFQKEIIISPKPRGFHLITNDIINSLNIITTVKYGLLNLFIKHTSASLTINENTDPTVRDDLNLTLIKLFQKNRDIIHTQWKVLMILLHI